MDPMLSGLDESSGLSPTSQTFTWAPLEDSPPAAATTPAQSTSHPQQQPQQMQSPGTADGTSDRPEHREIRKFVAKTFREGTTGKTCLACRGKHLRCSGTDPCLRCVTSNLECVYVASRRGRRSARTAHPPNQNHFQWLLPAPKEADQLLTNATGSPATSCQNELSLSVLADTVAATPSGGCLAPPLPPPVPSDLLLYSHAEPLSPQLSPAQTHLVAPGDVSDKLLTSFYYHAFAAHPFVLPQSHLARFRSDAMRPVIAAMRWVGSLYLDTHARARDCLYEEAHRLVYGTNTGQDEAPARDGFLVQAMMLLLVALDGCAQQQKAVQVLGSVEKLALEIGLHTRQFATLHGGGIPVLEESWRRTWWDLYMTDGMMAGVHRVTGFALFDVAADVQLPCEEHQYLSGDIPPPLSLQDLEDRDFCGDDVAFSSFAYRILSGQNLGALMRMPTACSPDDEHVKRLETRLTSWQLHLPRAKRDALHQDGKADEMMFQAHMMTNAMSIMLHQPFSQLDTSPVRSVDACAPAQETFGHKQMNSHTVQTITSASAISDMITWAGAPLLSHTHFFTCVVTLSSIVHLSRWALQTPSSGTADSDPLREQIRLNMGALEQRAAVWLAAGRARGQVASVARDIFQAKRRLDTSRRAADDAIMGEIGMIPAEDMPSMHE